MPTSSGLIRQAAAIPLKDDQICLVTSRNRRRWVIPKGCLEAGKSAGEIALQEAWEEAGLTGALQPEPVGTYVYEKAGFTCLVTVFVMNVTGVADDWPEHGQRQRRWLAADRAVDRIEEHGLREIIRGVTPLKVG